MENKVIVVIVTYNRLVLLKRAIDYVQKQTLAVNEIIVVNNGSTDGTADWLDKQTLLSVIHQDNVGGSGGFYTGIKLAYEKGASWIWCMDDDVYPEKSCLDTLMSYVVQNSEVGILCPRRIQANHIVYGETLKFNLSNPFRPLNNFLKEEDVGNQELVKIEGMAFEGPLISRKVVESVGLPNRELFIFFDDSDYSYRATLAGYDVVYCQKAILNKESFPIRKLLPGEYRNNWKLFYDLRNAAYFCKKYGKNSLFRLLGTCGKDCHAYLAALSSIFLNKKKYRIRDLVQITKAIYNGKKEFLGKIN